MHSYPVGGGHVSPEVALSRLRELAAKLEPGPEKEEVLGLCRMVQKFMQTRQVPVEMVVILQRRETMSLPKPTRPINPETPLMSEEQAFSMTRAILGQFTKK